MKMSVYPSYEFPKAVCTCGKELSIYFYRMTASSSFALFSSAVGLNETDTRNMLFSDQSLLENLNLCCKMSLRFGTVMSMSITEPGQISKRMMPEALPGPHSQEDTLYWA
jgi:hypothetical protein